MIEQLFHSTLEKVKKDSSQIISIIINNVAAAAAAARTMKAATPPLIIIPTFLWLSSSKMKMLDVNETVKKDHLANKPSVGVV